MLLLRSPFLVARLCSVSRVFKLLPEWNSERNFLYGLPKLHKPNIPMRPIVSFCGSPTYQLSKYLTTVLQPLTDQSRHKLQSTENFIDATIHWRHNITMTLKMTTAQVVETSVTVTNSSFQNHTHPDDHTTRTTDTPGFKPFTKFHI